MATMNDEETDCCGKVKDKIRNISWKNVLLRLFPIIKWLPQYDVKRDFRYDIIAGLTVGLTAVPQSLAYAQLGNIAPQYGLYSCFIGMIIYCFMGTSKDASIGPSALLSMLSGQLVASVTPVHLLEAGDSTCSTLFALMAGILLIIMGVCKLGFLVSLFSVPVVSGFTSASGFAIAASQIAALVGLKSPLQKPPGVFVRNLIFFFDNLNAMKTYDAIIGFTSIAFLFIMQFLPKIAQKLTELTQTDNSKLSTKEMLRSKLLSSIIMEFIQMVSAARNVILFAVAIPMAYYLSVFRPDIDISFVGKIPPGFPTMQVPSFYLKNVTTGDALKNPWRNQYFLSKAEPTILKPAVDLLEEMAAGIVIVTLMASLEMFAIEKALGRKNGYRVNASQELLCIGIANFLQGFVSGISVTAAVTRCALNDVCRVKTTLASLISAAVVMAVIGALTEIIQFVPKAALSAIIIAAAINLIDFNILKTLWKTHPQDFAIFVATFLMCLLYDIAYGVLICLLINLLTFLRPAVKMNMLVEVKLINIPGSREKQVAVVRLPQGMKYPSADKFSDKISTILQNVNEKNVLIDCQFVTGIDYTGLQAFFGLLLVAIELDKHVMFANVSESLARKLAKMGVAENFKMAATVEDAISKCANPLDRSPSISITPTGSVEMPITAFAADRSNTRLITQLSVEPSFFADIPISVGHIGLRSLSEHQNVVEESVDLASVVMQAQSEHDKKNANSPDANTESHLPPPAHQPSPKHVTIIVPQTNSGEPGSPVKSASRPYLPSNLPPPTHKTVAMKLIGAGGRPFMRRTSDQPPSTAISKTSSSGEPYTVRRSSFSGLLPPANIINVSTQSPVQHHHSEPLTSVPPKNPPSPIKAPIASKRETDL